MFIRLFFMLLSLCYLTSCASTPAHERLATTDLSQKGLIIGQFLYVGLDDDGEPTYSTMHNYFPRLVGDTKRNVKVPIDQDGMLAFPFAAGNYKLERLRNIDRKRELDTRIKTTRIYSLGDMPFSVTDQQVTNLGLVVMASVEKESNSYYLFTVDNQDMVGQYLKDHFADVIPEGFKYTLEPQAENVVSKAEMRNFLEQAFPADFLDGIAALN